MSATIPSHQAKYESEDLEDIFNHLVELRKTARVSMVGNNAGNAYAKEHLEQQFPKL